jgi:ubiquitin carboxyl-terminal hydrolase 9/13
MMAILNQLIELEEKRVHQSTKSQPLPHATWVHALFEGRRTTETRCLVCETSSFREETFLDVSVTVAPNTSVAGNLRRMAVAELLRDDSKYSCDHCASLQEARRTVSITKLPQVLLVHLQRFCFQEDSMEMQKVSVRVPFSTRMAIPAAHTGHDRRVYELKAVVVHAGTGPNRGHYTCVVHLAGNTWILYDDDLVIPMHEEELESLFGSAVETRASVECGYILLYCLAEPG